MKKKILYLDLDGVVADFDKAIYKICPEVAFYENKEQKSEKIDEIVKMNPFIFHDLPPFEGAIKSVKKLFDLYEVYFLSSPMSDIPESYSGKRIWLNKNFGEIVRKNLTLTHRKDLIIGDYLVDDRLKNGAKDFKGYHIHFGTKDFPDWKRTMIFLENNYK